MTTTTIKLIPVADETELYHQYPNDCNPAPVHLEIDCRIGGLRCRYKSEPGNAVSMAEWHGHMPKWVIPALLPTPANNLMAEVLPLAQRVLDGYESRWDGSNHVAVYDADAQDAMDAIEAICERINTWISPDEIVQVMDAGDYFGAIDAAAEYGITATTTDAELDALADQLNSESRYNDVHIVDGMLEYLTAVRQGLRDARAEGGAS